jgi:hypothetical protein
VLKDANPSGERQKNIDLALGLAQAGPRRMVAPTSIIASKIGPSRWVTLSRTALRCGLGSETVRSHDSPYHRTANC